MTIRGGDYTESMINNPEGVKRVIQYARYTEPGEKPSQSTIFYGRGEYKR
jgi:hypothetical protein